MYPRDSRLRTSREWQRVRRRGRCVTSTLTSFCVAPGSDRDRFAFSTTKGFVGAVERNRARRRLREVFRSVYSTSGAPVSVVGVAKPPARKVEYAALRTHVTEQLRALGLPVRTHDLKEL